MDRFAKNISKETVSEGEIGEEQEEESVDEDDIEDDEEDFEVEEESDPMELQAKTVANATSIWEHYKPRLLTNGARVAYLCSPHPTIIAHSEAHKDPTNNIAVEEFIKRVILPRRQRNDPDPNVVLAQLVDKFWAERDDFVKKRGFFS